MNKLLEYKELKISVIISCYNINISKMKEC